MDTYKVPVFVTSTCYVLPLSSISVFEFRCKSEPLKISPRFASYRNTDYVLVLEERLDDAVSALKKDGLIFDE